MRNTEIIFVTIILISSFSCVDRTPPEKAQHLDLGKMSMEYYPYHPKELRRKDLHSSLDYLLQPYIDTVNLDNFFRDKPAKAFLTDEVRKFYKETDHRLAWTTTYGMLPISKDLIGILGQAYKTGLNPDDYNIDEIIEKQRSVFQYDLPKSMEDLLELDILMTSRYILLGYHLNAGRIDPVEVLDRWLIKVEKPNLAVKLSEGLLKNDIESALNELEPKDDGYKQLKEYFLTYYNLLNSGIDAIEISDALLDLRPGDTSNFIPELKKKLVLFGDMDERVIGNNQYDDVLTVAIQQFQVRHGLEGTGLLNQATIDELNVSLFERLQSININLERYKWFPQMNDRYILVNVPEFKLRLYDNGEKKMEMKAIVGREVNPTPVMTEDMTYIVFNPTWTVPYSITTQKLLPEIQKDLKFLQRNNYLLYDDWGPNANLVDPEEVEWDDYTEENFPYVLVQQPGPGNALGQVQFMMPNNYAIYLHDTPAEYLFDRDERAFSHGCVRLERPLELADYLLQDRPGWSWDNMEDALSKDEPVNVVLPEEWPVHLLYNTAWVDEDGLLNFREDVYGLDSSQIAALERLDLIFPVARKQE